MRISLAFLDFVSIQSILSTRLASKAREVDDEAASLWLSERMKLARPPGLPQSANELWPQFGRVAVQFTCPPTL